MQRGPGKIQQLSNRVMINHCGTWELHGCTHQIKLSKCDERRSQPERFANMIKYVLWIYIYIYNFLWCTITIHTHLHAGMHTYIHIYTCMHAYAHLTVIPPYLHPNSIASRSWSRRSRTWAAIDGVELICRLLFKTFGSTRSMKSYIYTYIYYLLHHTIGPKMHNLR